MGAALLAACGGGPQPPAEVHRYHVGGTITGLAGSITLALNGGEQLSRGADGDFTFEGTLVDGSAYEVKVATPPAEQDCTVTGGTGSLAGADVTSVRVACAARTYALGGSVEGLDGTLVLRLSGGETLSLTRNGPFTFAAKLPKGGMYAVEVATLPTGQRCSVTNGSGTVAGAVDGISVRCDHWYVLNTFQAATRVMGQGDFTHNDPDGGGVTGPGSLHNPLGNAAFVGGKLYVPDTNSSRVLGFNGVPAANAGEASFVLGQPDFASFDIGAGKAGLGNPEGVSSDGTRLAIADTRNSRVLLHGTLPTSTGSTPTLVLGQKDFDGTSTGCTATSLAYPEDVFVGHGKLLVSDGTNNRILVWNTVPSTSGAPADLVLGQTGFTSCVENDADGNGTRDSAPGASTLWNPTGVWTDGTRLVVADSYNNRVLVWNTFPTRNGQPADLVLGQPDFTSRKLAVSATGMNAPTFLAATGLQLFVADSQSHRVLVWNAFPTANGQPAEAVLGQADFTSANTADPAGGTTPSARSLNQPGGVVLAWPYVGVSDYGNNRFLLFESH